MKNPPILTTSIALLLGLALLGAQARAQSSGVFSTSGALGFDDQSANVGLDPNKTYREAIDLGDTVSTLVNGVTFTGSGTGVAPAGNGWAFSGTNVFFGGGGPLPGGDLGLLTDKFIYNGNPAVLTLSGLAVGQTYVVTLYNRAWEAAGARIQTVTAAGASSASTVFDEDIGAGGQGDLNLLRYTFQAASATQTLSFKPQVVGTTMHFYAFTTEQTFNNTLGSGADWSTALWSVGQPNAAGANASFTAQAAPRSLNLDAARTVGHLQFDGTNAWTVSGSNTLTLESDLGGVSVLSALAGSHIISTPVTLNSDVVKFGAGTLALNGAVSGEKGVSVNAGTLILGAANSYTGGTTVNSGATLQLGAAGALGGGNGSLVVNGGGTVNLQGTSQSLVSLSGAGSIVNDASGTTSVLTVGGAEPSVFAGVIADRTTGTGTVALTKSDTSTLTLSGANSYTGLTTIADGRLQLNGSAAAGTLSTSGITVGATGALGFTADTGSTLALKEGSTVTLGGGTVAFDLGAAAASDKLTTTNLVLTANSAFAFNPVAGLDIGSTYTLATYTNLNRGAFNVAGTVAGRLTLTPVIGANAITVTPTLDSGTWNNPAGGTWSAGAWTNYTPTAAGDSAIFGSALTANGVVAIDSARSVGYLTFNNGAASYTLGTANSSNLTIDNGTNRAILDVKAGTHTIAENVALASDLLISVGNGSVLSVKGALSGSQALLKAGAGTLILANANTYGNGTTISQGTLQLGDGVTNGSVTGDIVNNAALVFNNGSAVTASNAISGTGAVTKTGTGVLTLTGNSSFSGGLTISSGTVDIGGNSANGSVTGPITNNGVLRFSRTGATVINSVVNGTGNTIIVGGASQTLAPGSSINTPTVTVGDTSQGWLVFGAPNQLNGTTGVVLNIAVHATNSRINLNGFSQTIAGLTGTGIVQSGEAGAVGAATLTINVSGTNKYSWNGLIRDQAAGSPLSLTKTGTGEQTMSFSITEPTYSGATTINEGRLIFGSTLAAPVWGTSGITVNAGAEVGLTAAGGGLVGWAEGVTISGAGGLTRIGADGNIITITNRSNSFTGATKLSGTGILAVSTLANIGVNSAIGRGDNAGAASNAASLVFDGGRLRYTGPAVNTDRLFTLTQSGGTIDASGSGPLNFSNSGALATAGTGARTLTLNGTNTGSNTLGSALADGAGGVTSLTKAQAGTWVLAGANSYTGATTINAGRLQLNGSAASGALTTSNLAVNAGATLGFTSGIGSTLTLANTLTLNGGSVFFDLGSAAGSDKIAMERLALTGNSTFRFNQIGAYEIGATYTLATYNTLNAGAFTVNGFTAGRLSLTPVVGANAITLTPALDSGVWNNTSGGTWSAGPWTNYTPTAAGDAARFDSKLTANGIVTVDSPRSVGYLTFENTAASYTIGSAGSANLTLANVGTAAAQIFVNSGNHAIAEDVTLANDLTIFTNSASGLTVSGALNGATRAVTKTGAGTLTLSGVNTFGGTATGLNINQGTVVLENAAALAPATGVVINGGTLDLNAHDVTIGSLSGTGGRVTDRSATAGATVLTVNQAGNASYLGTIEDGPARTLSLLKDGVGILTLSGTNSFSGGLTIAGGTLNAASTGVAIPGNVTLGAGTSAVWLMSGAGSQQYGANTVVTFANLGLDAKLQLRGSNQTLAGIESSRDQNLSIIQNDELTAPGYTTAPGNARLTLNTATDHSFYGIIRNEAGGTLGITKEGAGTQELIGHSSIVGLVYTGSTIINEGKLILNLSGVTAGGFASAITVNNSGTLGLDGDWTLARPVSGTGNVVKEGFGSVTVSGALSHTGNTTIAAGTLLLTGSLSGSTNIEVKSEAVLDVGGVSNGFSLGAAQTLKGEGSVLGALRVNGTLAPGNGLGTLTIDSLTFGSGGKLSLEINTSSVAGQLGASDLLAVNGTFNLGTGVLPTLSLSDLGGNVRLADGTRFTLVTYTGAWDGGLFNVQGTPIVDNGMFELGANRFILDYDAGGNSVVLVSVPEPTTGAILLAGLGTLLGLRRRRRA